MPNNMKVLLSMLKARYVVVIVTLLLTVATAALITDLLPRQYVATTSLVLNGSDSPFDAPVVTAKGTVAYLSTQLDIIRSRGVALSVVDALNLADDGENQNKFHEATGGEGDIREWLAENLLEELTVTPSGDSRVIALSYRSTNPQRAAATANAFADAYIQKTLEFRIDPARRNAAWFDEQLKNLRQRLLDSQSQLTHFQQEQGIISIDERLDTETNRLNELAKNYVQAQAEASDVRSRQLGQNHPEYKRAINREQDMRSSLTRQKDLLLELKKQRDKLGILAREVESNQRVYDATLERYYQTSLESQFNQANISILNAAAVPLLPSSPTVLFNYISAILFGLLLGLIFAVLAEVSDRRMRTPADIDAMLGARVLASV
ncbi:MAG: hypothetical protein LBV36_01890 [Chromatiales bacterium]|jgi:uncharacterized protein involved in exopolysaccharide biosynthesis|nr:hypothetical protein [Chromatiales bacterium]